MQHAKILTDLGEFEKLTVVFSSKIYFSFFQSQQQYMQYAEIQAETEMGGYIDGNRTKMTAGYMTQAAAAGPSSQMMAPNSNQKAPCLNCRLIQMGSAISYGDNSCPQCGETVVA